MQRNAAGGAGAAFEIRRRFRAPREALFRAWTRPEALRRWWFPSGWLADVIELDLRVGGAYRFGMRRVGSEDPVAVCGRFLEVRPPERLKFTWRWEGAFEAIPEMVVTLEFAELAGGSELTLRHEGFIDPAIGRQHRTGWIAACERLDQSVSAAP
jgi:uncharacterized protein YndB with AHSA1/START domain